MLGSSRLKELSVYKQPGLGLDLADCVERILTVTVSYTPAAVRGVASDSSLAEPNSSRETPSHC